jgi:RimJ/RimL family protein N-acetyltransferase
VTGVLSPLPQRLALRDGTPVRLRPIRPDDKARLAAALGRLSDESTRQRFLVPKPRFTRAELAYLTEVDGHDHLAVVATAAGEPGEIVGVARCVRASEDPRSAEFAVVVDDAHQGLGLGTALARAIAEAARAHGISRFTATAVSDNVAVVRLVETISRHLELAPAGDGVTTLVADLAA